MPRKKTKRFIDKKNSSTFYLAQRSWRDPLHASEEGSQYLLMPLEETDKRKKEQQNFGIYFDDDYNYLQHLKESTQHLHSNINESESNLKLPASSLLGVELENHDSFLNKTVNVLRPDWDPDIVAALDDDINLENSENQLDDDFITQANEETYFDTINHITKHNQNLKKSSLYDISDEDESNVVEEAKSKFSDYSISSSVIRRNSGLKFIDGKFEKLFEDYSNENVGALDQEEIHGHLEPDSTLLNYISEQTNSSYISKKNKYEFDLSKVVFDDIEENLSESDSSNSLVDMFLDHPMKNFDCESILTTISTTVNQPLKITELPKDLSHKLKLPFNNKLPQRESKVKQFSDVIKLPNGKVITKSKNETTEERKMRKKFVKQVKKERRLEKKLNKVAFKSEQQKQEKAVFNLKQNLQGIKIN